MPRKRTAIYPSDSINYPRVFIQVPITRSPERLHLWNEVRETAVGRGETRTAFILRAIAREVVRCKRLEDSKAAPNSFTSIRPLILLSYGAVRSK